MTFLPAGSRHQRRVGARVRDARSGARKAAVLLLSLGPERSAEVLRRLSEDEIEAVSSEMATLQRVDPTTEDEVLKELVATVTAYDSVRRGGTEYAGAVLEQAVGPDRAAAIMGRITAVVEERPFDFLSQVAPERVVAMLGGESAQTVALVVAYLHPTLGGPVLSQLPDDVQAEAALRIAQMRTVSPDVVRGVEQVIRDRFTTADPVATESGVEALAGILARADRSLERTVLEALAETDRELGEEVRQLLFTFEDLALLDDRAIQLVLREVDQRDLALALRGVEETVKERVVANLSSRAAAMLLDDLAAQAPQRRRVVEEAQGRVVAVMRRLEEEDAIILARGEQDAVV